MASLIERSPRERGASVAMYALIVAAVAMATVGAVRVLGSSTESSLETAGSALGTSDDSAEEAAPSSDGDRPPSPAGDPGGSSAGSSGGTRNATKTPPTKPEPSFLTEPVPADEPDAPNPLAMAADSPGGQKSGRSFSSGPEGSISRVVKGKPYCLSGGARVVHQQPCDQSFDESFQAWRDKDSGTLKLEIGGKCLGVNSLKNDKAPVVAQVCSDGDPSQDWTYDSRGRFVNEHSKKCLDVDGGKATIRAVRQRACKNSSAQVWTAPLPD